MSLGLSTTSVHEDDSLFHMDKLPLLDELFTVPLLADRPQNPIMDALSRKHTSHDDRDRARVSSYVAQQHEHESETIVNIVNTLSFELHNWQDYAKPGLHPQSYLTSWDQVSQRSLSVLNQGQDISPFLSDQEAPRVAVAHEQSFSFAQLFSSLKLVVLGTSSQLYQWEPTKEIFVTTADENSLCTTTIEGQDKTISNEFVLRFITVGTILRRLENLVSNLRACTIGDSSTIHAFSHALSLVVAHIRARLVANTTLWKDLDHEDANSSDIWIQYSHYETIARSLGHLCHRSVEVYPPDYQSLPLSATHLLSHIYNHLSAEIDKSSSRGAIAIIAYLLTNTSRPYFQDLCVSVGYTERDLGLLASHVSERPEDDLADDVEILRRKLPDFMPPNLINILLNAQRSLKLLRAAIPEHPVLEANRGASAIEWVWSQEDVYRLWHAQGSPQYDERQQNNGQSSVSHNPSQRRYRPEISDFQYFDMEPNSHTNSRLEAQGFDTLLGSIDRFLETFPETLPSITPTLLDLTSLILEPLAAHASLLLRTLVAVFLEDYSHFHLRTHLLILRSHFLLTSQAFRSRLEAALFSDSNQPEQTIRDQVVLHRRHSLSNPHQNARRNYATWAIGLASGLTESETWPPGGSDLGYRLRTVIVDSLDQSAAEVNLLERHRKEWREAEYRLDFALRELPVKSGRERWLNPLALEALDFLYMEYKPPHPIRVLIPPDVISRYQRMFTFILRVLRVDNVVRTVFRLSRDANNPLFPTLKSSETLMLHFRFVAHSFTTSLSSYIFDTAIRGHFDDFLREISSGAQADILSKMASAGGHADAASPHHSDVFSISQRHSEVMDAILGACLLRSGLKDAQDMLRGCLDSILRFGVLIGERYRGHLEEYQASPALQDIWQTFYERTNSLIQQLRTLSANGADLYQNRHMTRTRADSPAFDEREDIIKLLVRLDVTEWWHPAARNLDIDTLL